eukprot:TRINITY_DN2141_c0_g2_i1.p1 TRINITY_DN2141_c0_g2~~TRINITY_DN2141_c0_g2_i1.p1  ORF type:complete len:296 (-),score=95.45 TRINITY_DN2141_c0_g2_i1:191-1039(-)
MSSRSKRISAGPATSKRVAKAPVRFGTDADTAKPATKSTRAAAKPKAAAKASTAKKAAPKAKATASKAKAATTKKAPASKTKAPATTKKAPAKATTSKAKTTTTTSRAKAAAAKPAAKKAAPKTTARASTTSKRTTTAAAKAAAPKKAAAPAKDRSSRATSKAAAPAAATKKKAKKPSAFDSLSEAQQEALNKMSVQELKDRMKANDQLVGGTRNELVSRIADYIQNGVMPRCPSCFGGRLKPSGTGYKCPGFRDDDHHHFCNYKTTSAVRPAWVPASGASV